MRHLAITLLLLLGSIAAWAASPFETAASLYSKGDYEGAVKAYESAMEKEGSSAGALFNLGNAYYRLNDYGRARVCYERARKLDPRNSEINNNLQFLAERVSDRNKAELKERTRNMDPDQLTFFETIYKWAAVDRTSNFWAVLAGLAFILALGCAATYLFSNRVEVRKMGFFNGLVFFGFSVAFVCLAFSSASFFRSADQGVVTAYKVELLSDPNPEAKPCTSPFTAGTKVQILESKGDWRKVKLNGSNVGWLPEADLTVI